ncbi:hypothetical protein BDZ97DRAFT_1766526 [Flammula alnicola]|nr:hypothetical protein BDZ97DRAFT_1766526 [Flammula alnicola]
MCKTHVDIEREDYDPDDTASKMEGSVTSPEPMLKNKTLNGGRSERNKYIHRLIYVCPDKTYGKKTSKAEPQEDDEQGGKTTKAKRDKYKVFEPKRGIIQEYNIDFTTVEPVDDDDSGNERIPEPPSSDIGQDTLPRLIATLVNRRREVKKLMKDRTSTQAQLLQYDIKQQALKLTADRTRDLDTHTRELAESLNLDVVYGDTNSGFVNSNVTDLAEALKISATFKQAVNDRYKLLEIDLDGVFQRLLLLQKKKSAAIKVDDGTRTSTEIKGLDMKRREYCAFYRNKFHIVRATPKRLAKNPEDYPDAKSQPHVQVALRMKQRGGSAKTGDVIPYIFCLSEGQERAKSAQADRARHLDEFREAGSALKIDYEHYLLHQVLRPIERLCERIEGTDRARLAEGLGLDPMRYRTSTGDERMFSGLDSQISDAERFRDAVPFFVRRRHCQGRLNFLPLDHPEFFRQTFYPACSKTISAGSLQTQLEAQIRDFIAK